MIQIDKEYLASAFMRYVKIDTQSDPESNSSPTTEKQKDLSKLLAGELNDLGFENIEPDQYGYVYARLKSNSNKNVPAIAFCAHVDTAPDCSGTNVKPILHRNISGDDIILPDDTSQVLNVSNSPYLKNHIGKDIITASGLTLLGADDKSGVAAIMAAVKFLKANPQLKHGDISIVFTVDEEVGKGTDKISMEKINAEYGYTLDGGEAGSLEEETFSADGAIIEISGVIAHPGYAKNKLVNSMKIAGAFLDALPKNEWSPETTDKKEGFIHPTSINGISENTRLTFIIRDFKTENLEKHHEKLEGILKTVVAKFPGTKYKYTKQEQYRNMKDVLVKYPDVVKYAAEAIRRTGLEVHTESIRGGTDGSRLSFMGLPCPNIFTGMQNIHSKLEWIGVDDMTKAAETIVHLSMIWEENS